MTRILRLLLIAAIALPAWLATAATEITVCDALNTNEYVPVYGYWIDTKDVETQMIYPASMFTGLDGGRKNQIESITFYSNAAVPAIIGGATVTVRMGETISTEFTSPGQMASNRQNMVEVYHGHLATGSSTMTINFTTPYVYRGNNIIVDIYVDAGASNCDQCFWIGESNNTETSWSWNNKIGGLAFLPKMTISYNPVNAELIKDFGSVNVGSSSTITISEAGTPVVNAPSVFNVVSDGSTITVTFTPTDAANYQGTITVNGKTYTIKGIGKGVVPSGQTSTGPVATRDKNFYSNISYTWKEGGPTSSGDEHISFLDEIATDPDQIIAMLSKVYTDKSIPGNWYRSNAKNSTYDNYNDVLYTGVGTISYSDGTQPVGPATAKVLDIAKYATITDAGATVSGMSKIYNYNENNSWLTLSCYGAMQADDNQNWLTTSSLSRYNRSWDATDIFQGKSAYFGNSTGYAIYGNGSQTYYVTNCVQVKAYLYSNSSSYNSSMSIYECTIDNDGNLTASTSATDTQQGSSGVLTSATLDESKYYKVQVNGGGNYPELCEIGFKKGSLNNEYSGSEAGYKYVDSYGWNISGTIETNSSNSHFQIDEYKPDAEGVTLLLVELVDGFKPDKQYTAQNGYSDLRNYVATSMKSARVITEAKRSGSTSDQSSGTLFKIDCDKMNDFFFLAKGQLLEFTNNGGGYGYPNYNSNAYQDYGLSSSGYLDTEPPLFCHMFEQFSPSTTDQAAITDIYSKLINMDNFPVVHDCPNVPYVKGQGHGFSMYNSDYSGDCQDVTDMMFFIPDYRMLYHSNRKPSSSNSSDYYLYNTSHQPTMAMYVIVQDPIDGDQVEGKDMYKLTLTWDSNLDEFLPSDNQVYYLYQVVIDENGTEQYNPVYYMNSDGKYTDKNGAVLQDQTKPVQIELEMSPSSGKKTYTEVYVPMKEASQQVTFAVQGQDATKFLDLKMSNTEDFIIPGLDKNELVSLTDANHYSRYNPQTQTNCYSNKISVANTALGLVNANITDGENGTKLTLMRSDKPVATITFNNHDTSSRSITITMANQDSKSLFPVGQNAVNGTKLPAGYHANKNNTEGNGSWTQSYTLKNGYVNFGSLDIYDNFVADVSKNEHPNSYTYQLTSNYEGMTTMYLDVPAAYMNTGEGVPYWYAYTWKDNDDSVNPAWVKGTVLETNSNGDYKYVFFLDNVMDKIILVRTNPNHSNIPSWDAKWNQTQNLNIVDGCTYKITSWHDNDNYDNLSVAGEGGYTAPAEGYSSTAHSNSFDVRVYKTDSKANNIHDRDAVDDDESGATFESETFTFQEKVQYSSKKQILRYDVYRWNVTDDYYILDKVRANDDEDDLPPTGIAANQDGSYSVSMNENTSSEYFTSNVTVGQGENDKWAVFTDYYPGSEASTVGENGATKPIGQAFTYAPVVETFTTGLQANSTTKARTDYNTYGGPQQSFAVGKFELSQVEPGSDEDALMSDYYWEVDGKKYSYYNIRLSVDNKSIPDGYEIYKIRAWREVNPSVLKEEFTEFQDRVSGRYMFEDRTFPDYDKGESYALGSELKNVTVTQTNQVSEEQYQHKIYYTLGTFGAERVRTTNESLDDQTVRQTPIEVGFFVRIYMTRTSNLADLNTTQSQGSKAEPVLDADGKYYLVEAQTSVTIEPGSVVTGLVQNLNSREVVGVKYYNTLGIESDRPFDGVNIVVTRYSDGSTTSTKILK